MNIMKEKMKPIIKKTTELANGNIFKKEKIEVRFFGILIFQHIFHDIPKSSEKETLLSE